MTYLAFMQSATPTDFASAMVYVIVGLMALVGTLAGLVAFMVKSGFTRLESKIDTHYATLADLLEKCTVALTKAAVAIRNAK